RVIGKSEAKNVRAILLRVVQSSKHRVELFWRVVLAKVFGEGREIRVDGRRLSEDVVRHETKDHVRDLTVFANRHACAAVLGRQQVSPLAGEAEIRVANPRQHSL